MCYELWEEAPDERVSSIFTVGLAAKYGGHSTGWVRGRDHTWTVSMGGTSGRGWRRDREHRK